MALTPIPQDLTGKGVAPEGLEEGDDGDDGHDDHDRYLSSQRAGARVHAFTHPALRRCAQSRPALWDPMSWSPPGSSVLGIYQARILEWVASSPSRGSS